MSLFRDAAMCGFGYDIHASSRIECRVECDRACSCNCSRSWDMALDYPLKVILYLGLRCVKIVFGVADDVSVEVVHVVE